MDPQIQHELLLATKEVRKPTETEKNFHYRIAKTVLEGTDALWESLSENTQNWVNATYTNTATLDSEVENNSKFASPEIESLKTDDARIKTKNASSDLIRKLVLTYPEANKAQVSAMLKASDIPASKGTLHTVFYETKATVALLHNLGIINTLEVSAKMKDKADNG